MARNDLRARKSLRARNAPSPPARVSRYAPYFNVHFNENFNVRMQFTASDDYKCQISLYVVWTAA